MDASMATEPAVCNPNAEVIEGLRDAADWLEAHPDVAKAGGAYLFLHRLDHNASARDFLKGVAASFGPDAVESCDGHDVSIKRRFAGGVQVTATESMRALGAREPLAPPPYDPILPVSSEGSAT